MPNLKLSQTAEPARSGRLKYVDTRWDQLLRLVEDSELRALKYLTLTNAGGAVATLSFLGASESVRKLLLPKISLGFFISGLFAVGVLAALSAHKMAYLLREWKLTANKYTSDETTWGDLLAEDNARVEKGRKAIISFAYLAFACFIAGALVGLWALFWS
ncbi:MAG: hypothetical protein K0M39_01630 [Rhizobium sp.]|jgi:hypothetical protein|nr:hypothetical protein [Rhizobium sp.]